MLRRNIILVSWIMLGVAIAAWCIAGLMWWRIGAGEKEYAANAETSQASAGQMQNAAIARVAVKQSSVDAAELSSALNVDPVAFANLLQSVGPASGTSLQISDALPESAPSETVPKGSPQIYAFGFDVQTTGSFSAVMQALQLLQTLPAPSSVQEVDLARSPGAGNAPASWQMDVHVNLVTTDDLSS